MGNIRLLKLLQKFKKRGTFSSWRFAFSSFIRAVDRQRLPGVDLCRKRVSKARAHAKRKMFHNVGVTGNDWEIWFYVLHVLSDKPSKPGRADVCKDVAVWSWLRPGGKRRRRRREGSVEDPWGTLRNTHTQIHTPTRTHIRLVSRWC